MTLLFIDTNIFLDFYRQVGRESNLSILKHLRPHHDRIITGLWFNAELLIVAREQ